MCDVLMPISHNTMEVHHTHRIKDRRASMLGKLKDCILKRSFSESTDDESPVKRLATEEAVLRSPTMLKTTEMRNHPLRPVVTVQLPRVVDCFNIKDRNISSFKEHQVHNMWNAVLYSVNNYNAPYSEKHFILQSLEYFKHINQFPNLSMQTSSRQFWVKQVIVDLTRMITECPKILSDTHVFRLCILFLHILVQPHPFSKFFSDAVSVMQLVELRKNILRKCDHDTFNEFIEIHCGCEIQEEMSRNSPMVPENNSLKMSLKWFPMFSLNFRKSMTDNVVMPMLTKEIDSWEFPDAFIKIIDILKPWQPVVGSKRMSILQKYVAQCAMHCLEKGRWTPTDPRVLILFKGISPFIDTERKETFINRCVVPIIESKFQMLGKISTRPPKIDNVKILWDNIISWTSFIPYELMTTCVAVHYMPEVMNQLYKWLASVPKIMELQYWFHDLVQMIPQDMCKSICIERYLSCISNIIKHFDGHSNHQLVNIEVPSNDTPLNLAKPSVSSPEESKIELINIEPVFIKEETASPQFSEPRRSTTPSVNDDEENSHTPTSNDDIENIESRSFLNSPALRETGFSCSTPDSMSLPSASPKALVDVRKSEVKSVPDLRHLSCTLNKLQRSTSHVITYKQMLKEKADNLGINFTIVPKKLESGNQVYQFGPLKLYIKSGKIYVYSSDSNQWKPTNISIIHELL